MSLTPSHIIEYLFCPRFTYFEYVLQIPQYEDRHYKVQKGRDVHTQKARKNTDYLRKRLGVREKFVEQYLTSAELRGQVDEVLVLADGTMAPLDYKFAQYKDRIYQTYETQLYCYAVLIETNFQKPVHKGFLIYTRSQNRLIEVPIDEKAKGTIKRYCQEIYKIIEDNVFPKATSYKKRCVTCTYRNICVK